MRGSEQRPLLRAAAVLTLTAALAAPAAATFAGPATAFSPGPTPIPAPNTPVPSPTPTYDSKEYAWGPYYAKKGRAKAQGTVHVEVNLDDGSNKVVVRGRLWNQPHRMKHGCARVEFVIRHLRTDPAKWRRGPSYTWCGPAPSARPFTIRARDVDRIRVRVSQIGGWGRPTADSAWQQVYPLL